MFNYLAELQSTGAVHPPPHCRNSPTESRAAEPGSRPKASVPAHDDSRCAAAVQLVARASNCWLLGCRSGVFPDAAERAAAIDEVMLAIEELESTMADDTHHIDDLRCALSTSIDRCEWPR